MYVFAIFGPDNITVSHIKILIFIIFIIVPILSIHYTSPCLPSVWDPSNAFLDEPGVEKQDGVCFFWCQLSNGDHSNMVQYGQDYCKDNFNMITIVHLITSLLLLLHIGVKGRKKRKKKRRFFSDLLPQNRERCWKSSWRDFLDLKERQGEMFIQALLIMSSSTWFP